MANEEERKSRFWVGGLITSHEGNHYGFWVGGLITSHEGNHYGYMMNTTSCCWNVVIFESANKTSKTKTSLNCRQIWLDCKQQSENAKPGLLWWKSNLEPNTRVVEHFLIFSTVICAPRYDKWSNSYELLNISQAAISLCWQSGTTQENCIFDHPSIIISENL
jgi:hypothetical protein